MLKTFSLCRQVHYLNKVQSSKGVINICYQVQPTLLKGTQFKNKQKFAMQRSWKPNLLELADNNCDKTIQNYKLLSYNILGQDLLMEHLHLYYNIDSKILYWENRLNKIKQEILKIDPDILCLQEMQYNHLQALVNTISTSKQGRKWEYVFKKKTGFRSDGCVIIYDRTKFKLISEHFVEYHTVGVPTLNRDNIAVMAKFQAVDNSSSQFIVATTHLLYNPKREDVRISQVHKLINAIINFSSHNNALVGKRRLPVILTGDFNFTPETDAFKILTASHLPSIQPEKSQHAENCFQLEAIDFGMVNGASTNQGQWITVDYILKSRSQSDKYIQVNYIYQLPSVEQCYKNGKIPNKFVGSDHFLLAINFAII